MALPLYSTAQLHVQYTVAQTQRYPAERDSHIASPSKRCTSSAASLLDVDMVDSVNSMPWP